MAVDAAVADLAHQVHAHRVAAEREERAMAEREDPGVAPDQVERQREQGEADVLAEQRDQIVRQMQRRGRREAVEQRHADEKDQRHQRERQPAERGEQRVGS